MANWISPKQKKILSLLNPQLQEEFMESFLGEECFPGKEDGPKVAKKILELVKNHPFWGQKTSDGKYKFIRNPQPSKVRKFWTKEKMAIQCGGYFCDEPFFTIVCETGEIYSLTNSCQVYGHKEKFFMMRLNKFQEKYEIQYGERARDIHGDLLGDCEPWSFFPESELMEY